MGKNVFLMYQCEPCEGYVAMYFICLIFFDLDCSAFSFSGFGVIYSCVCSLLAFLPKVFIVSDHIETTQSSGNTEHTTNTYVRVITDPINLALDMEHATEETISDIVATQL